MNIQNLLTALLKDKTDNTFIQFFRYLFVGGIAYIVDFGFLFILTEYVHLHYILSASLSFLAGLLVNYAISKIWVFSKGTVVNKQVEFMIFGLIGLVGLALNAGFMFLFTSFFSFHYLISKIQATVFVYLWNFTARKFLLFNNREQTTNG